MIDKNYIITFGKYKGLPLKSIIKFDVKYIIWCKNTIEWFKLEESFNKEVIDKYIEWTRFSGNQQQAWAYGFGKSAKNVRNKVDSELFDIEYEERKKYNVLDGWLEK